jgi:outer membrane protein OmpA-like peptidoglycan-associated protein/tetratricopeptide (TPR) repeat protein
MKSVIFYSLIFFLIQQAIGQEIEITKLKNWQLKGYGKSAERMGDYYSIIDFYSEYVKRNPGDIEYSLKLADSYFISKNYKKAKNLYDKVYNSDPKKYPTALFYYAQVLKTEQKYDSARMCFLKFRELTADYENLELYSYLVNIEVESCDFALKNQIPFNDISISHMNNSINKVNLESAPLIFNDSTLIYSSLNIDSIPIIPSNAESDFPVNRFYSAQLHNDIWQGQFEAPEPFYNFDNQNTSNGVFSLDKQRFYFTSAKRNWKNKIIGTLYVSINKKGIWQKPIKLDERINFEKYTSTQPAIGITFDNNFEVIYFISDRPGGWGGMDIWYTVYDISFGTYKNPVNAGGYINTPGDEVTPYYDNLTKTLYFSSNGLPGYGGYDIFKSNGWLVNWSPAENVGLPLNSSFDDIYYSKFQNIDKGFVVSNRDGALFSKNPNCCFDIFEFSIIDNQKIESKQDYVQLNETANKNNHNKLISSIDIIKHSIDSSLHEINKEKARANTPDNSSTSNFNKTGSAIDKVDTVVIKKSAPKLFIISNIYFEFNNSMLTDESKTVLDSTLLVIMLAYPNIILEIGAHTDHLGSNFYNMGLSRKRASSVVQYLISKGINKERLIPIGYGETKPLVLSVDQYGRDIPQAREKNRRIEFKLVGLINE